MIAAAFLTGLAVPVVLCVAWQSLPVKRRRQRHRDATARAGYPGL